MINFEKYKRRYRTDTNSDQVVDDLIDELIARGLNDYYRISETVADEMGINLAEAQIFTSFKTINKLKKLSENEKLTKRCELLAERRRWANVPHNFDKTNPVECKEKVISLKKQGKSIRAIAKELSIPAASVHRFLK